MAGSTLNGFGLKTSDADLSFLKECVKSCDKDTSINLLTNLSKHFDHYGEYDNILEDTKNKA